MAPRFEIRRTYDPDAAAEDRRLRALASRPGPGGPASGGVAAVAGLDSEDEQARGGEGGGPG